MRPDWRRSSLISLLVAVFSADFCVQAAKCSDRISTCARATHMCDHAKLGTTIRRNCALSCGVCKATSPHACSDNPRCAEWVPKGFCNSSLYPKDHKQRMCPQSCSLCPTSFKAKRRKPKKHKPKRKPKKRKPKKKRTPRTSNERPYAVFKNSINPRANPCNDFFEFACGTYVSRHPTRTPADNFATFNDLQERVTQQQMEVIMDKTPGTSTAVKTMQAFRDKCFDVAAIDKDRTTTLWANMQKIGQGFPLLSAAFDPTKFDLVDTLVQMTKATGQHFLYDIEASKMPDGKVAPVVSPADLLVTQPTVYEEKDAAAKIQALHDFLVEIIGLIAYDQKSTKTFQDIEAGIDWDKYLKDNDRLSPEVKAFFTKDPDVYMFTDKVLKEVDAFHKAGDPKVLANYLFVLFIIKHIPYLDDRFVAAGNRFAEKLDGSPHKSDRKQDCYDQILGTFPLVSDHLYAKKHLSARTVKMMDGMIEDLRNGMAAMFRAERWMGSKSRDYAVRKVKKMKKIIGIVDAAKDEKKLDKRYEGIKFGASDSYLQMAVAVAKYGAQQELQQLINPALVTQSESMRSTDVNAMHIWEENLIFMSAALLQSPFFDPAQPAAVNYGSIGFIIGHEMTVSSQYDENGTAKDWWDGSTKKKFDDKAKCFIDMYGRQVEPKTRKKVDGQLTIPENINGGVRAAYKAYLRHLKGKRERHVKGYSKYTNAQSFFISYGTSFCNNFSKEQLEERLKTDTHSPMRMRVNVVLSNYPEFAKAFKCRKGTKMNPRKQCSVW
ncbi:Neprilysin-1 [Aphelenchoides fujianensis]|nr:Neprilysin-1 [Aphelenchoides fujianensis]